MFQEKGKGKEKGIETDKWREEGAEEKDKDKEERKKGKETAEGGWLTPGDYSFGRPADMIALNLTLNLDIKGSQVMLNTLSNGVVWKYDAAASSSEHHMQENKQNKTMLTDEDMEQH